MFLLAQTKPDCAFLAARCNVPDWPELKAAIDTSLQTVDLNKMRRDSEHSLFHHDNSRRILQFHEFIRAL